MNVQRFAGEGIHKFMGQVPDWTEVTNQAIEGRGMERRAMHQAESQVAGTGLSAQAEVKAAEYAAEATRAQGAAQGQASIASGIGSLASGIAGGFGTRGGGSSFGYDPAGSQGNPFGTGPRVRAGGY